MDFDAIASGMLQIYFDLITSERIAIDSALKCQRNCNGFCCVMFCVIFLDTLESMMHLVKDVYGKLFWRMMYIVMVYVMEDALLFVCPMIHLNCIGNVNS